MFCDGLCLGWLLVVDLYLFGGCWLIVANWMVFAFAGLGWVVLMCLVLPLRICLVMLGFGCSIVIRAGLRCCFIVMYYYVAGFVRLLV